MVLTNTDMEYFELNNGNKVPGISYSHGMITRGIAIPKNVFQLLSNKIKF